MNITPSSPQDSPAIANASTTNDNNTSHASLLLNNETEIRRVDDSFPLTNTYLLVKMLVIQYILIF